MKRKIPLLILAALVLAAIVYLLVAPHRRAMILTGVVTTDEVVVGSEIQGRLEQMLAREGDAVTNGQLLTLIQPQEWSADVAFYTNTARQVSAEVAQAEADLAYQEAQSSNLIRQSEANLAATRDQVTQAEADLENAQLTFHREEGLYHQGVDTVQVFDQARTSFDAAQARAASLRKQVNVAESALALSKATSLQVTARRAALHASQDQDAAANAQAKKARVQLGYTEIRSPTNGVVDLRAALAGEVVSPGQAVVTLVNPDDLWVRADVEETYIDRIRLGDTFTVRLPSGVEREGTVFYRGLDADYATQRDVNRSKRDIKTFEIRLRCDNRDRALAVGMTAYVTFPNSAR